MVHRFTNSLLLCLLFIMCGGGNATRDLDDKTAGNKMKDLEGKQPLIPFYKTTDDKMKDLGGKQPLIPLYETTDDKMKDLGGKQPLVPLYKTTDDKMKDLGGKQPLVPLYKTTDDKMKDLGGKQPLIPLYKTTDDKMKDLERKDHNIEHYGHNHDERVEIGLFTLDELRGFSVGKKLPIFFPIKGQSLYPPSLPKEVADAIPFSSSQVSNILQFFSVSPDSPKGKDIQFTLKVCENEAAEGETKFCATSLESLHDFLSNAFGPEVDFKFISTWHPTMTTPILQNYTVLESPREIESQKKVACHPMSYLYAVYFCHFDATESKTFKLQLVGDITGDEVDALVVCHMDTSGWSFDHIAFSIYGLKHGGPLCHVFPQGHLVWINRPSISVPPKFQTAAR